MNQLSFGLTLKQNPYNGEPDSEYEIWGQIILKLNHTPSKTIEILNHQWDIIEVYEWFQKCKDLLPADPFPFRFENEKCIAECRDILYEKHDFKDFNEEIEYYDNLENYFSDHHFKLKGTDTPILFIGLKNNTGEISWFEAEKNAYTYFSFNMDYFIESTKNEFTALLSQWKNSPEGKNQKVSERIKEIENTYGSYL